MSNNRSTVPTWADLNDFERPKLIHAALDGGIRAPGGDQRVRQLADKGLLAITKQDIAFTAYTLTQAGRDMVLSCPNDYQRDGFPLLSDVQRAKAAVRRIEDGARR